MFGITYLLGNLIVFWNFALLYGFLFIQSVPLFLTEIIEKMMDFFFIASGSLTFEINKRLNREDATESLFDFSVLESEEKIN